MDTEDGRGGSEVSLRPLSGRVLLLLVVSLVLIHGPERLRGQERPGAPPGWAVMPLELDEIRAALRGAGLRDADAQIGVDGRVTLTGQYRDRAEVELAFSMARSIVGVRRLAPTTPERIRERLPGAGQSLADAIRRIPKQGGPAQPPDVGRAHQTSKHALIVGINSFTRASSLRQAEKDAHDYHAFLIDPRGAGVPRANVRLLTGRDATAQAIKDAMRIGRAHV